MNLTAPSWRPIRLDSHQRYAPDEFKGMNIRDLIPDKYREGFNDYLNRVIENGRDDGLLRIRTKEGDDRIVEYKNVLIAIRIQHRGISRDRPGTSTEQVKAQKALKESTEKYRNIIETCRRVISEVDLARQALPSSTHVYATVSAIPPMSSPA